MSPGGRNKVRPLSQILELSHHAAKSSLQPVDIRLQFVMSLFLFQRDERAFG